MNRLIDTMTDVEIHRKLSPLFSDTFFYENDATLLTEELKNLFKEDEATEAYKRLGWSSEVKAELENLFKPVPHWSANLDPKDNQTWVLCFVSDDSPEETWLSAWVTNVFEDGYVVPCRSDRWKYATPIDLNLRYKEATSDD